MKAPWDPSYTTLRDSFIGVLQQETDWQELCLKTVIDFTLWQT